MKVITRRSLTFFVVKKEMEDYRNAKDKITGCYIYDYDGNRNGVCDGGIQHCNRQGRGKE